MFNTLDALPYAAVTLALIHLALLSRRLGEVTRAAPFYRGMLFSAGLVAVGAAVRLLDNFWQMPSDLHVGWVLLYSGFPAMGVTVALVFAWRYWSWLLAERD